MIPYTHIGRGNKSQEQSGGGFLDSLHFEQTPQLFYPGISKALSFCPSQSYIPNTDGLQDEAKPVKTIENSLPGDPIIHSRFKENLLG